MEQQRDDEQRRGQRQQDGVGIDVGPHVAPSPGPLDVVRTLPREAQELLGSAAHDALAAGGGYLGAVEVQDPVELLASGEL